MSLSSAESERSSWDCDCQTFEEDDPTEFMIRRADLDRLDGLAFHPTRCILWPKDPVAVEEEMLESHIQAELGMAFAKSIVWRVAVLAGLELTAASTIRRLCTYNTALPGIESATAVKEHRGSIFVFVGRGIDPTELLKRVAYVKLFPLPCIVDLAMQETASLDLLWHWVRIIQPGLYCGDLAKVIEISDYDDSMTILVVPRLPIGQPGRPKQNLYLPTEEFGEYSGYTFRNGLLVLTAISWYDVSEEYVYPLAEEEELFTGISSFWAPSSRISEFEVEPGDQVVILSGQWSGRVAEIISNRQGSYLQLDLCYQDDCNRVKPFAIQMSEVRVLFAVHDLVEVTVGKYAGNTGYIQALDWEKSIVNVGQRRTALLDLQDVYREPRWQKLDRKSQWRVFQVDIKHIRIINRDREIPETKPFDQMEVVITGGKHDWRGYYAVVVRSSPGNCEIEVAVEGLAVGRPIIKLDVTDVLERTTHLPLATAQRVGPAIRLANLRSKTPLPVRCSTPELNMEECAHAQEPQAPALPEPEPHWLSDKRLLRARLDVKIENSSNYRNGILEGRTGFIRAQDRLAVPHVAKKPTVQVLIGLQHKMFKIPTQYVSPQTTTEREGETTKEAATSILSQIGATVVIIGEDTEGCGDYVGYVGEVVSEYGAVRLVREMDRQDLLQVLPEGEIVRGFGEESVCRTSNRIGY
ncbi:hypothetical protein B0H16DRAFT_1490164 [Mycena metata]|uniref:KOW domain-containing protein n=1 Tax=Mycena metata TaxID=1033252 RepID=A0AAD7KJM2_9AGAR|nr:hypothetical protein B0H16DRAFT_1490164 [Mycena metata]